MDKKINAEIILTDWQLSCQIGEDKLNCFGSVFLFASFSHCHFLTDPVLKMYISPRKHFSDVPFTGIRTVRNSSQISLKSPFFF